MGRRAARRQRSPFLNEVAKRGASQSLLQLHLVDADLSSMKLRSVELRNRSGGNRSPACSTVLNEVAKRGASQSAHQRLGVVLEVSSMKLRSVELRNLDSKLRGTLIEHPQ